MLNYNTIKNIYRKKEINLLQKFNIFKKSSLKKNY